MNNNKFCTVVSDASFCHKTKIGGWAVHMVCAGVRLRLHNSFKGVCDSSIDAEIKAIIIGCIMAKKHFGTNRVHVVTDCLQAIYKIKHGKDENMRLMREKICGIYVTFAHVKAHTDIKDSRSHVNRWCDEMARNKMYEKRRMVASY